MPKKKVSDTTKQESLYQQSISGLAPGLSARKVDIKKESKDDDKPRKQLTEKGLLGDRIKVTHGAKIKHGSPYLPDGHLSILICGKSGSGKSTIVSDIVPAIKDLAQIIVVTKIQGNPVFVAMQEWAESKNIEYIEVYDIDSAQEAIESAIESKDPERYGLVISDDMTEYSSSRDNKVNKFLAMVNGMLRNHKYHNIVITQDVTNFATLLRSNCSVLISFAMGNFWGAQALEKVFLTNTPPNLDRKEASALFQDLFTLIQGTQHACMWLNLAGNDHRIFVSIPGETQGLEEVDPKDGAGSVADIIENDTKLQELINELRAIEHNRDKRGASLTRLDSRSARQFLEQYCSLISARKNINYGSLIDAVEQLLHD